MNKTYRAIGLMSGTSLDGIDLSMIESDGEFNIKIIGNDYLPYENSFRNKIRELIFSPNVSLKNIKLIENELTILHADLIKNFLQKNNLSPANIDIIGFHGQTIYHNPALQITWQIGNSQLLASLTQINVVGDFRVKDVVEGGQGAPLVPIYHYYLFSKLEKPCAILNIGGICNLTYFDNDLKNLIAFDICYGNAPMNDLMFKIFGKEFDENGDLARQGVPNMQLATQIINSKILNLPVPRSFSRNDFDDILQPLSNLEINDALATHIEIISQVIKRDVQENLPVGPKNIVLCGGGAKNKFLHEKIQQKLPICKIVTAQEVGMNIDFIEAEAFAFLAIRKLQNLPISFPKTTATKTINGSRGGVLFEV